MIIPDINLLIYAYNADAPSHLPAKHWWEHCITQPRVVGLPWAVACGFIRLMTHRRVLETPLLPGQAIAHVRSWLARSHVHVVDPGTRHLAILGELFRATGVGANLTTDAHLAAIAIEYQAELHSNDADFARFPGLRWSNPVSS